MAFLIWLLALTGAGSTAPAKPGTRSPHCASNSDCLNRLPSLDRSLCDPAGKTEVALDLDGDGRPEVWKLYLKADRKVLTCTKSDLDRDGSVDSSRHLDPKGAPLLEEMDLDSDGKVDTITIHAGSQRHRHTVGPNTACINRLCTPARK